MHETLILLWPGTGAIESVVQTIEAMAGRVLSSVPPEAVVALLPSRGIDELRANPAVRLAATESIQADGLGAVSDTTQLAVDAWNERLARQDEPPGPLSRDLSWGAPDHLPPDPPANIQELLRRRERDMQGDQDEASSSATEPD